MNTDLISSHIVSVEYITTHSKALYYRAMFDKASQSPCKGSMGNPPV